MKPSLLSFHIVYIYNIYKSPVSSTFLVVFPLRFFPVFCSCIYNVSTNSLVLFAIVRFYIVSLPLHLSLFIYMFIHITTHKLSLSLSSFSLSLVNSFDILLPNIIEAILECCLSASNSPFRITVKYYVRTKINQFFIVVAFICIHSMYCAIHAKTCPYKAL